MKEFLAEFSFEIPKIEDFIVSERETISIGKGRYVSTIALGKWALKEYNEIKYRDLVAFGQRQIYHELAVACLGEAEVKKRLKE